MIEKLKQQQRDRTLALQRLRRLARDRSPFLKYYLPKVSENAKIQGQLNI